MKLDYNSKKNLYMDWIQRLRADKIAETQKKVKRFGSLDEDDYNFLVPDDDYKWVPKADDADGDFHGYKLWSENYADMIDSFPPVVVPYSAMAGNYYRILHKYRRFRWNPAFPFDEYMEDIHKYDLDHCIGQVHHFSGDIMIGLTLGWDGILEKVLHYAGLNGDRDAETREFYCAEEKLVRTIIGWIERTCEEIERKYLAETDPFLKDNLLEMLEVNRHVAHKPPRTLREACQFISWYNIAGRCYNREGCGGQLDQILLPYYEADIADGAIDDEDAIFYIVGLLLSDTKYYQLGGPDAHGHDMVNAVSWLILEAADRLNITANLTVRVHDGLDPAFFHRSVELLFKHKNAWPRFSGDKALISGFMRNGFSQELASKRIAVGCNWMAIPGLEFGVNDTIKINFAKVFEVAFEEMFFSEEKSTEKLWALFEKHLAKVMELTVKTTDFHLRTNRYNSPELFLNLFCYGPIEKGRDASDHSLEYYNISVDGAGIAVAADSFAALEQRVENEKKLTWVDIYNAVHCNYNGPAGAVAQAFMKTAEKFGQYDSLGLKWAKRISRTFSELVSSRRGEEGEIFIPGLFSWSKTIRFGETVGATPDGRKAGEAINHGANPMPGSVKNGEMTTMSEAIAEVQCGYGNTAPFQMELDPGITEAQGGVEKVMALIKTHLDHGGTLININIIDADKILAAHKNPDLFPDLVVRVTGFTAYFCTLSPEFRQLVVDRIIKADGT